MMLSWIRRPSVQKALRIGGYLFFGLFVFTASFILTFPVGRLRPLIEARLSRGGFNVSISELNMSGLSSLAISGLKVEFPPEPQGEGGKKGVLEVERLKVSLSLLRTLFGGLGVTLQAYQGDGVFGPVKIVRSDDRLEIDVEEIHDYPLPSKLPLFGVTFSGRLEGKGTISYDLSKGWAGSKGQLDLVIGDLVAHRPTLRHKDLGEARLSDIRASKVTLKARLAPRNEVPALRKARTAGNDTVLHFEAFEVDGPDIKVLFEGQSFMKMVQGHKFLDSVLSLDLAFSLSDEFFNREVKKKDGQVETPNRFLKTLLDMDPRWRAAFSGGYWGLMCSGTLRSPSCMPKKPSIRGGEFAMPKKPAVEEQKEERKASPPPPPPAPKPAPPPKVESKQEEASPAPPTPEPPPPPAQVEIPPSQVVQPAVREGIEAVRRITPTIIGRPKFKKALNMQGESEGESSQGEGEGAPSEGGETPQSPHQPSQE